MTIIKRPLQVLDKGGSAVQALGIYDETLVGDAQAVQNLDGSTSTSIEAHIVRLAAISDTYIAIGSAPDATTLGVFMPEGLVEYYKILPGNKIASTGELNIAVAY